VATQADRGRSLDELGDPAPPVTHDLMWTVVVAAGERRAADDAPVSMRKVVIAVVAAALVVLALVAAVGSVIAQRTAERQGVHDAAVMTDLLATSTVQPQLTDAVLTDPDAAATAFEPIAKAVVVEPVTRIKIWTVQGRILWSDDSSLIGRIFALDDEAKTALTGGKVVAAVSDVNRPENVDERNEGRLLEVYRPVWTPSGEPLLFEAYFRYDAVSARSTQLWHGFLGILLSSLLATLLLLTPIVWGLVSRTRRAQAQREALLQRAADVSLIERRRIAGALHDGLVQELAASSYVVAAQAEQAQRRGDTEAATALRETATSVRSGIGGLRALLVDLYPPNLRAAGLAAALRDVSSALVARGLHVDVTVDDAAVDRLDEQQQEAVFRVGQECVRNAERHARAGAVALVLALEGDIVRLEVTDDGIGMDDGEQAGREDSFGRRLMADQAERVGAELSVRSAPGAGTTVRMEVPVG
jgi:two-component system, NarL family, sensor kinase